MKKLLPAAALAALLALPGPSRAQGDAPAAPGDAPAAPGDARSFDLGLTVSTLGGAFDGKGVLRESGGVAVVEAAARPEVRGERWRLEVPLRAAHRETFGVELSETTGALAVEPWYVARKGLRVGLEAGVSGADRRGWPDPYQRDAVTGELAATDRYSFLAWRGGVQLYARPAPRQHLRARYRHVDYAFVEDERFTEDDLMHITPRDRAEEHLDVSWRYLQKTWDLALRADYEYRRYDTLLARNRRSGATPEDGAGNELNPTQRLSVLSPSIELGLKRLGGAAHLDLRYGLDFQDDKHQGYYSYTAHHPRISARIALGDRATVQAAYEGWYRTYGVNGSTRLDSGSRRKDARTELSAGLRYRAAGGLYLVGEARYTARSTNYTDLVQLDPIDPTTLLPQRTYDIDYDYTNVVGLAGLEYRL